MIRHLWSVLCSSSSIDRDDNKLSLFDIVEQITLLEPITEPGLIPIKIHLVTLWRRESLAHATKTTARVRVLVPPQGEEVSKSHEYVVDLTKFVRLRQRIVFRTIPVRGEGTYEFVIDYLDADERWREATRIPLDLVVKTPPAAPDTTADPTTTH
jgi:hypothetical protein